MPAVADLAQLPRRLQEVAALGELHLAFREGERLAIVFLELRLVVEEVDVRRATVHEEEDHALGAGRELGRKLSCGTSSLGEEGVEGETPESETDAVEGTAPVQLGGIAESRHLR